MIAAPEVQADLKQFVKETGVEADTSSGPPTTIAPMPRDQPPRVKRDAIARHWYRGRVARWGPRFGFIERDDGETFFFDSRSLVGEMAPEEQSEVLFWGSGETGKKYELAVTVLVRGQVVGGIVADVPTAAAYSIILVTDKRGNFNHVLLPFAHPTNQRAHTYKIGTPVEFQVDQNKKGALAINARDTEGAGQSADVGLRLAS